MPGMQSAGSSFDVENSAVANRKTEIGMLEVLAAKRCSVAEPVWHFCVVGTRFLLVSCQLVALASFYLNAQHAC